VADKNFKVKSGLQVPSLTTAGPVTTDSSGNVTSTAALPLSQGGTGQTTAGNALNALLPLQTGNTNKYLQSNGVSTQWNAVTQQTVTDALAGTNIYTGTTAPSSPTTGDIWIDNTTGNGIQLVRWRKTIASGTSTISGLDDNNLTLTYTAGNEQVYINGVLITRGQDYTATNGTSISLTQAVEIGDTVEIFGNPLFSVTDTYTQSQSNNLYVAKSGLDASGKNYVINGAMDFWQRGTSSSVGAWSTVDRWWTDCAGSGTFAQDTSIVPEGIKNSIKITSTGGIQPLIYQIIETANTYPLIGKTVTLSAWCATSNLSNVTLRLEYHTSVDAALYGGGFTQIGTVNMSTTQAMSRGTATFNIPSNARTLRVGIYSSQANFTSGQWLAITGVQLELGSVATAFSRSAVNIQGELTACQKYYIRYEKSGGNQTYFASGQTISTTRAMMSLSLPTNMRIANPSIGRSAGVSLYNMGSNYNLSALSVYQSAQNILNLDANVASGLTSNTPVMLSLTANGDYLDFSAEL
jgi:hypothetical protein